MCLCIGKRLFCCDERTSKSGALSDNSNVTNSQTEVEVQDGTEVGGQIHCQQTGYGATDDIDLTSFL